MARQKKKKFRQWFFILAALAAVFLAISLAEILAKRKSVADTISSLKEEIQELEATNSQLVDLASYLETEGFVESQAREKFNLAKPDERLVIIKDEAELDGRRPRASGAGEEEGPSNLQLWKEYFFN